MKVAIYVEGLTEMTFVYRLIRIVYDDDWCRFHVWCVNSASSGVEDLYPYGDSQAPNYYLIINCESDQAVVSKLLKNADNQLSCGYDKIIGLRDVYSKGYKAVYGDNFSPDNVRNFINSCQSTISQVKLGNPISLHFAIMEIEAWFLALERILHEIDCRLTPSFLKNNLSFDYTLDPETAFFHPCSKLKEIYRSIELSYNKHYEEIKNIVFKFQSADIKDLLGSNKCNSFNEFYEDLFQSMS